MRIGIDSRLWSEAGVGRYIRNLVFNLSKIDRDNEYYLLLFKKNLGQKLPGNFHQIEADVHWYTLREQKELPKILNSLELDLVHFPHFNIPVFYSGKFVVTIHDLIHQHHKMKRATTLNPLIYQIKHLAYNFALKTALKKSEKVITVSNYVKDQLRKDWKVPENKMVVTYEAVEDNLVNLSKRITEEDIKKTLEKYNINPPFTAKQEPSGFIFYVGNAHPHKNLENLIKAFLNLRKKYQYLQLVLAGNDHYFWRRIKKEYPHRDIIYPGFISDEEMVALYKSAQSYIIPSLEEGFGIPLLEAMALSCPVISSNKASLPEIGGDAALYFDPTNLEDISKKIKEILNSDRLKKELIEKGQKRVKLFSWEKLAKETLKVYEDSLSS